MASYKGIEVDETLKAYLPYMSKVEEYREMLQRLQAVWDNLSLLGQMSGTTAEMGNTRAAFASLTNDLINNLAGQTLAKRQLDMAARSQVIIDILVRNLFERTADIGFLAIDGEIRRFAAEGGDPALLRERFREYVRKYSVYEDVVLLSPHGDILAALQEVPRPERVAESWLHDAVRTEAAYVEAYGPSTLFGGAPEALVYAYRVVSAQGQLLGVLALCFRFEDEMARIFAGLTQNDDATVLVLLDRDGRVIASQDRWQVPLGATIRTRGCGLQRLRFAGRNYLAAASTTRGYQGYMGPGWTGLVLLPLDEAFVGEGEETLAVRHDLLASVLDGGRAFPEALRAIPGKADAIQRNLSRSVWNGTVRLSASSAAVNPAFSKILLWEISRTGMRMREVFASSIGNLQTTVLSSWMADAAFLAGLAIDIMDRNLYERANDCRWWALDASLRQLLARPVGDGGAEIGKVLASIHTLYTVYARLIVFDREGRIQAVSSPADGDLIGQALGEGWVDECLALPNSQAYAVSPFAPSFLYDGQPTYTYAAAIRSPDEREVVGGIAVVFDATPQFSAMLADVLPRAADGQVVAGSFALFVDGEGRVIASSDPARSPGSQMTLPAELLSPGEGGVRMLLSLEGQVMAAGAQASRGYREYKGADDAYRNALTAIVFIPLGEHDQAAGPPVAGPDFGSNDGHPPPAGPSCEIATFMLGQYWLGLPVSAVVEAIELADAARLPNAPKHVFGALIYRGETLPLYNLHAALGLAVGQPNQVVVVRGDDGLLFGILVDRLGEVPEVPLDAIADVSSVYVGVTPVLASVVRPPPGSDRPMLTLLSVASMANSLRG